MRKQFLFFRQSMPSLPAARRESTVGWQPIIGSEANVTTPTSATAHWLSSTSECAQMSILSSHRRRDIMRRSVAGTFPTAMTIGTISSNDNCSSRQYSMQSPGLKHGFLALDFTKSFRE
jgi:hypothetical protein